MGLDFYQSYSNPKNSMHSFGRSAGSILPLFLGVQGQIGHGDYGLGLEAQINFAPLALDVNEFKGLGALSFPLMIKFNAGSLSGFSKKLKGFGIGGGIQYNRTELFGTTAKYKSLGRDFFKTYLVEFNAGAGLSGLKAVFYIRYGFNSEQASSFNTGILLNIDFRKKNEKTNLQNPLRI